MLHAWLDRRPFLGDHLSRIVLGGMFLPIAMAAGRAVGTWAMPGGRLVLTPFDDLAPEQAAAFAADFKEIRRYLGQTDDHVQPCANGCGRWARLPAALCRRCQTEARLAELRV